MNIISANLQKGDLCAVTFYGSKLDAAIFHKDTGHSLQFLRLDHYTLTELKAGKKPHIDYISGGYYQSRAVKITEDVLQPADFAVYQEFKKL